jgi:preprotein translocase subunit SecD
MLHFSPARAALIVLFALAVCLCAVPNFLPDGVVKNLPTWAQRHIVLGLDLQGGSYILLAVDTDQVRKDMVAATLDDTRRVLRDAKIGYTGLAARQNAVEVHIREGFDPQVALSKLRDLSQPIGGFLSTSGQRTLDVTDGGGGLIRLAVTDAALQDRIRQTVDTSVQVVERRVNELGTVEPTIQRQGADRIMVQVPGLSDPQRLLDILGHTGKLTFRLVDESVSIDQALQGRVPPDSEILYGTEKEGKHPYLIEKQVMVEGSDLTSARPAFDQRNGQPVVDFTFNSRGATRFAKVTTDNVGHRFAIVLDNEVISAPVIQTPITQGQGQISGSFTVEQTVDLAIVLKSGALPARLTPVEQRTVGAGLGQDSIERGKLASYVGAALVVIFMLVTYGLFGLFANIAVVINVAMIFGALSLLGATLTLPGICGVVLTIGIAVDSNVLIYERIREELRAGRSAIAAIDAGFTRALATILDSNITTFIAAAVLFSIGTGPVRGFAVTLGLGILTSLYTAFTMTRLIVAWWVRVVRPKRVPI